jgi:hypothetical protein
MATNFFQSPQKWGCHMFLESSKNMLHVPFFLQLKNFDCHLKNYDGWMVTIFFKSPILMGNRNKEKGVCDESPNFLQDSNVSPKMKTIEEGIGTCCLIHNTSAIRRACWSSKMGTRTSDKHVN